MHANDRSFLRILSFGLLTIWMLAASGCAAFDRDWKKAAALPVQPGSLEGRWQGSWLSEVNGHHGKLRCLVTKRDAGRYEARFHAKYQRILSFGYTVILDVQKAGDTFEFQGSADLGWLAGGEYRYDGQANATNFFSRYNSKQDHGTFQMRRP